MDGLRSRLNRALSGCHVPFRSWHVQSGAEYALLSRVFEGRCRLATGFDCIRDGTDAVYLKDLSRFPRWPWQCAENAAHHGHSDRELYYADVPRARRCVSGDEHVALVPIPWAHLVHQPPALRPWRARTAYFALLAAGRMVALLRLQYGPKHRDAADHRAATRDA